MIFYFSGTGNSKWVAEQLGRKIGEKVSDISQLMKNDFSGYTAKKEEIIGFVFPVYAWAAPQLVSDFARTIKNSIDSYTFAVCTCGDEAGYTIEKFAKVISLNSGYSIIMPNNYMLGFNVDEEIIIDRKIINASSKLVEISEDILNKKNGIFTKKGKFPWIKSVVISRLFQRYGRNTKPFHIDGECNECKVCELQCPMNNIVMEEGKPKWKLNCMMCMRCINRCPKIAIQYGSGTKKKGRYYFGITNK